MSQKTIVSAFTLLGSLGAFYYSRTQHKDAAPYVLVGSFVGALVGEIIISGK